MRRFPRSLGIAFHGLEDGGGSPAGPCGGGRPDRRRGGQGTEPGAGNERRRAPAWGGPAAGRRRGRGTLDGARGESGTARAAGAGSLLPASSETSSPVGMQTASRTRDPTSSVYVPSPRCRANVGASIGSIVSPTGPIAGTGRGCRRNRGCWRLRSPSLRGSPNWPFRTRSHRNAFRRTTWRGERARRRRRAREKQTRPGKSSRGCNRYEGLR